MDACLDVEFISALEEIKKGLNAGQVEIDSKDDSVSVDIWVRVDENSYRFNCPIFTVYDHGFMGFSFEPSFFESSFFKNSDYSPDCAIISITPLSSLYARTDKYSVTLNEVIVETQKYVKEIEGNRVLREELYYQFKKYMGYPVDSRPSDKKIIARANPDIKSTSLKTERMLSNDGTRRRYDIGGFYSS